MADNILHIKRHLPVLIRRNNRDYVMAEADIYRDEKKVLIQITSTGPDSQILAEYLEQPEPIALSFTAIPVQNAREKRDKI